MQKDRRDFVKKVGLASVGVAAVAVGSSALANTNEENSNAVIKGSSRSKEILYKKTAAWEEYYKNAK